MDDLTRGIVSLIGGPLPLGDLVKGRDGCVYALPRQKGQQVRRINPQNSSVCEMGPPLKTALPHGYFAADDAGVLYGLSMHSPPKILRIDPNTGDVREMPHDLGRRLAGANHSCLALAPNGSLYSPPASVGHVLEINPADGGVALVGDKIEESNNNQVVQVDQYRSIAVARNGCLYSPPRDANHVLEIDPARRKVSIIGEAIEAGVADKYTELCLAGNGKLYAAPDEASRVLEIDPEAHAARQIGLDLKQYGGFSPLSMDRTGRLWAASISTTLPEAVLLEVCAEEGEVKVHKLAEFMTGAPTSGANAVYDLWAMAGNGRFYGFPCTFGFHVVEVNLRHGTAHEIGEPLQYELVGHPIVADNGCVFAEGWSELEVRLLQISYNSLPKQEHKTGAALQDALATGDMSDVVVKTGPHRTYRAHKLILALKSPVFRSMFAAGMREANDALVDLGDVPPSVSDVFMNYIYAGHAEAESISLDELSQLSALAHRFEVADLSNACASLLRSSIGVNNAADILRLADRLQQSDLKQACLDFIVANPDVVDTDGWDHVDKDLLREVAEALAGRRRKRQRPSDLEFSVDTEWEKLPVPKLRRACAERGLAQAGKKADLVHRLQA